MQATYSSKEFSFADFRPLPFLGNPHVQTLLGHIFRGPCVTLPTRRSVVRLPDGDGLLLHDNTPPGWTPGGPIAVLVHGLTGSAESFVIHRLAVLLLDSGVRVVRLDQRGAGAGLPLARHFYHAGLSEDLRAALEEVHRWSLESPLLLVGVSLGGNVTLKLAGEAAERPVAGLARVAVIAPPIDLERCSDLMGHWRNRIYQSRFLAEMIENAQKRQQLFPDLPPLRFPRRMTFRLFDELYTAPRSGFGDAIDYYRRNSAAPFIPRINLPTLILTARDDPFIAVEPFEALTPPPNVTLRIVERGGHVGFLGRDGLGGIRWAERRVVEWLVKDLPPRRTNGQPHL